MAESEKIQAGVMHVAIQVATVILMALREGDAGPTSGASTANVGEACRHRHGKPALK